MFNLHLPQMFPWEIIALILMAIVCLPGSRWFRRIRIANNDFVPYYLCELLLAVFGCGSVALLLGSMVHPMHIFQQGV